MECLRALTLSVLLVSCTAGSQDLPADATAAPTSAWCAYAYRRSCDRGLVPGNLLVQLSRRIEDGARAYECFLTVPDVAGAAGALDCACGAVIGQHPRDYAESHRFSVRRLCCPAPRSEWAGPLEEWCRLPPADAGRD